MDREVGGRLEANHGAERRERVRDGRDGLRGVPFGEFVIGGWFIGDC